MNFALLLLGGAVLTKMLDSRKMRELLADAERDRQANAHMDMLLRDHKRALLWAARTKAQEFVWPSTH